MANKRDDSPAAKVEDSRAPIPTRDHYVLHLYVTGMTPQSTSALANIKTICEEHLQGRYNLEVIDVYQQPRRARDEKIFATPTLIKELPAPLRRLVGNLADQERVLLGLDLRHNDKAGETP